jgi:DNA-binding PadR family transcriptional regulator
MGMRMNIGGCGPRSRNGIPEALIGLAAASRGWQGSWGPGGWSFEWGGGGGRGGRHGRRGRARRMFESGELRLVLLKLIADQPRHGYDLIRAVEEMTGGEYAPSPGVVYPTLTMLLDMGHIEEAEAEGARKAFSITPEGQAELDDKAEEVEALFERLAELKPEQEHHGRAPIKRAVGNLLSAIWHRVADEEMDDETLHQIAAVLDEAAQKIERLK